MSYLARAIASARSWWPGRKRKRRDESLQALDTTLAATAEAVSDAGGASREGVKILLERLDERRRLDLNQIDEDARATRAWGSDEHRAARDKRERGYEATRKEYEKLSEDELEAALRQDQ